MPVVRVGSVKEFTEACREERIVLLIRFPKIQHYGIIGDCRSAALISTHGSIEWLCWPRFDSPAIFAAMLDREMGGSWSITPRGEHQTSRSYIENTNILETRFECQNGSATLTDLMPVDSE